MRRWLGGRVYGVLILLLGLPLVALLTSSRSTGRYIGDGIVVVVLIAVIVLTWTLSGRPRARRR